VNDFGRSVVPWLHPALGLVTVVLAVRVARLGLGARAPGRRGARSRARHRAVTPWFYGLVLANWLLGLLTVVLFRSDLEVTQSTHFLVGSVVAALLTLAGLISRRIPFDPRARAAHPWVGGSALLLLGLQVFLGLQITRW
jgi:nitrate reductase gamma subunit